MKPSGKRIGAVLARHATVIGRQPHQWFHTFVFPVFDVIVFGSIAMYVSGGAKTTAAGFLVVGIVLWYLTAQSQLRVTLSFYEEVDTDNVLNVVVAPMPLWEYLVASAIFSLGLTLVTVAAMALTANALFGFSVLTLGWAAVPLALCLVVVGWAVALVVIATVVRFGRGAQVMAWGLLTLVLPLSGVFYPVTALPAALQPIARVLPTTYVFAVSRDLIEGRAMSWSALGVAAGTAATSLVLAALLLRAAVRSLLRRGAITQFS